MASEGGTKVGRLSNPPWGVKAAGGGGGPTEARRTAPPGAVAESVLAGDGSFRYQGKATLIPLPAGGWWCGTLPASESIWAFGGVQVPREEARAVLLPVAYDLTTTYGTGARNGPRALLEASTHMELFDEELGFTPSDVGVHTAEIVDQIASGPEGMVRLVSRLLGEILDEGRLPILVGGDHSLTIGAFLAFEERKRPVTVLHLDAHADLREEYQGTPFSHACVMARGRERFPCVSVGIRSLSEPEWKRVQFERLAVFPARRIREDREEFLAEVSPLLARPIYLTLDLDVLDPAILPSTGTPEPGGLAWEEVLWLVRSLTAGREVVGFDVMELSPIPGFRAPDFLAAKLLNKILGYTCPPGRGRDGPGLSSSLGPSSDDTVTLGPVRSARGWSDDSAGVD